MEFPLQYLVVIVKSITYLSIPSGFSAENSLHVLNHIGNVYGDDDVSLFKSKLFAEVRCEILRGLVVKP